jgi:hypothetical protein
MFVNPATATYARDAGRGTLRWTQEYSPKTVALHTPVRGAAYGPAHAPPANTIFVNSVDWCSSAWKSDEEESQPHEKR